MVNQKLKSSEEDQNQTLIMVAWTAMLLTSSLVLIIWRELAGVEPPWWPWVHLVGLLALFAFTFIRSALKPLRRFILILVLIFILGFGGGWQWGFIPYVRGSAMWINWINEAPWGLTALGTHLLRLTPALVILLVLFLMGRSRRDFYLVKGKIDAPAQPSRLLGVKKPEPWTRIGTIFAIVISVGTFTFLALTVHLSFNAFTNVLPLFPVVLVIAAINGFNEEFTLRSAPLSELIPAIGKQQALLITTGFFGLGHFYGIPNGVIGVLLSGFLGWFLGKSILETGGFFWAWLIHFMQDIIIFTFLAILA